MIRTYRTEQQISLREFAKEIGKVVGTINGSKYIAGIDYDAPMLKITFGDARDLKLILPEQFNDWLFLQTMDLID